jgi:hypothetical protein
VRDRKKEKKRKEKKRNRWKWIRRTLQSFIIEFKDKAEMKNPGGNELPLSRSRSRSWRSACARKRPNSDADWRLRAAVSGDSDGEVDVAKFAALAGGASGA